jgi:hypothetical protein
MACLPFAGGSQIYGPAGGWCWIVKEEPSWRVGTWYGPLLIFFGYVMTMYVWIVRRLYSQKRDELYHREDAEQLRQKWNASMKLTKYPLIFILLWIFPIINRGSSDILNLHS